MPKGIVSYGYIYSALHYIIKVFYITSSDDYNSFYNPHYQLC